MFKDNLGYSVRLRDHETIAWEVLKIFQISIEKKHTYDENSDYYVHIIDSYF